MFWGYKVRFHDLEKVLGFNPGMVEFHLTDEDVINGKLDGKIYDVDYSIHLPEYWKQQLINPCNFNLLKENISIYWECISKGLDLRSNFTNKNPLKVILHPGGMNIDKIENINDTTVLYKNLETFILYLCLNPQYATLIEILPENMPPLPWFYGGQYYNNIFVVPEEIKAFCDRTGHKICLDISHLGLYANYSKRNLAECIDVLLPYTKQIHLADAEGECGEGACMGEGNIDFRMIIDKIKNLNCAVIPEVMWGHKLNYREFNRIIEECNKWLI